MIICRILLYVRNKSIVIIESRCVIVKVLFGILWCDVSVIMIGNYVNLSFKEIFDCWFFYCFVIFKINIYILGLKG